mmetsp:Transcript_33919/g.105361  ORF Transcript_33919/g.105361 Transcript_33919/m.105361 type:complete len:192 (+) Transcript_33919:54-629(+)
MGARAASCCCCTQDLARPAAGEEFVQRPQAPWLRADEAPLPLAAASAMAPPIVPERRAAEPGAPERPGALPSDFVAILDRRGGERLGIDVDQMDGAWLLVESVNGGLVERWNSKHPTQMLLEGSRVLEVNGVRGDVPRMLAECREHQLLELHVRPSALRCPPPEPPPLQRRERPLVHGLCNCGREAALCEA